jgi:hypothetical protein
VVCGMAHTHPQMFPPRCPGPEARPVAPGVMVALVRHYPQVSQNPHVLCPAVSCTPAHTCRCTPPPAPVKEPSGSPHSPFPPPTVLVVLLLVLSMLLLSRTLLSYRQRLKATKGVSCIQDKIHRNKKRKSSPFANHLLLSPICLNVTLHCWSQPYQL